MPKTYTKRKFRKEDQSLLNKLKYKEKYLDTDKIIYRKLTKGQGYEHVEYLVGELPSNRVEAKRNNIPFYYSKKPCPEGHLAPFYVEANYCVSCTKQKTAKSDRKNKKIYNRIKHFSLESKILELMKGARNRARQYEGQTYQYNLTLDYMKKLWMAQKGTCFYTGEKLRFNDYSSDKYNLENSLHDIKNFKYLKTSEEIKSFDSLILSIDKIIPIKGYTKENVIFCSRSANYMKHDLTIEKFSQYSKIIANLNIKHESEKILSSVENLEIDETIFIEEDRKEAKNQKKAQIIFKYLLLFSKMNNTNRFLKYEFSKFLAKDIKKKKDLINEFKTEKDTQLNSSLGYKVTGYFNSITHRLFKNPRIIHGYKVEIINSKIINTKGIHTGSKKVDVLITEIKKGSDEI